jgi:ketosteroid isomerase-like protein
VSRENVEVVRRAWEASTQRDNEAVFRLYDPEVEIHDVFYNRVYRDLDGVREYFGDWVSTFDEWGAEVEEWIDAGDDVIAVLRSRGRGKRSGIRVEERQSHVWTLRDSKLWRLRIYASKGEALKAVGLEE